MSRLDSSAVRAPARLRAPSHRTPGDDDGRPRLRLVVSKGRLGVELEQPFSLGPIAVSDLALSFPDARFPVELCGGLGSFRHRRGELDRLAIDITAAPEFFARELTGLFDPGQRPDLLLAPIEDGFLVGLRGQRAALAFEVIVAAADDDLRLIPMAARGFELPAAPQTVALRALKSITRPFGKAIGGAIVIGQACRELVQALLPLAGMRAPAASAMRWAPPEPAIGALRLCADTATPPAPSARAVSAVEVAALAAPAEEALAAGAVDEARRHYLNALERAPRHPELARRLAEIDRLAGRHDVALGVLADLGPAADAGALAGELFASRDRGAAIAAFERAAEAEPYGAMAAACWQRVADLSEGPASAAAIDRAVSRAPSWAALRWRRFEKRLRAGDIDLALADGAELEATARGANARQEAAQRVAEALLSARHLDHAAAWFERSLRYRPDASSAVAGLARSLAMLGHGRRALELLSRAVGLCHRLRAEPARTHALTIELARALVDFADDRPAAIAHVRSVPALVPEACEARLCEGRWRAELGDASGAGEAFARLADEVERSLGALVEPHDPAHRQSPPSSAPKRRDAATAIASYLHEAALLSERERGDRLAAQRLLSLALRLDPRRPQIQAAFRRIHQPPPSPAAAAGRMPAVDAAAPAPAEDDELLAERLAEQVRANPSDTAVVTSLADALERLGRDHDLLALLSARIDEESEPIRSELSARRRRVLERLRAAAVAGARPAEVELYELMLARD